MSSTMSVFGTKGNYLVLKKSGPLTQLLNCKSSADKPRVPASAGLSQVPWFHWSTLVFPGVSVTRFAMKIGCVLVEFIHCKTMVLSVHINTLSTETVNARQISLFKLAARRVACNSKIGNVITFIGATRAFPRTNASSVVIFPEVQVT